MLMKFEFKNTFLFILILLFSFGCSSVKKSKVESRKSKVESRKSKGLESETSSQKIKNLALKTGAENYKEYLPLLANKKIGIVTNPTGIIENKKHLVDFLLDNKVELQKIYAPEHGFRGTADAGEVIKDGKDIKTNLPIISLYGNNKKPKPEQLADIDVILFDIQDVGARFYTYISTLHYVMEACAENNIELLVLDRPNPNGSIVDGPVLEIEHKSFVGMHPIPVLHGMTIGEYAKMINGEKWLANGVMCNLTVIPCANYKREMPYSLPIKPSPNLPNDQSINLYASLCFFEGTNVSVGRGTEKQFQIYGSPFLLKTDFSFIPILNFGAKEPMHKDILCYGEDLSKIKKVNRLELKWLIKAYANTSDKTVFFNDFFTKLAGTKKLQEQIIEGVSEKEIRKSWEADLNAFKEMRKLYLIYN
ncbi:exo-beta-N-acetylmuramidase NamZ domain-containing protein [Flavobacterium sp.]|uniref:exo-beta-N-acetylmuramidase NamZ family protein n=1 Tax=Flavobacterium sp. TaxID=239 RepID=UPI0037BF83FA